MLKNFSIITFTKVLFFNKVGYKSGYIKVMLFYYIC